jgi:hypothetical protein
MKIQAIEAAVKMAMPIRIIGRLPYRSDTTPDSIRLLE